MRPLRRRQQQAKRRNGQRIRSKNSRRTQQATSGTETQSASSRRNAVESVGKLDKSSALQAIKDMGIAVDSQSNIDTATARKVAEGAAVSAAKSLGIDIRKADGSIDTAKARLAVSQVQGFSIERDGATQHAEAAQRTQKAAIAAADAMGADIRDAAGNIDTAKAQQVADLALDFKVAKAKQLSRREVVDALNISLNAMTSADPLSRRAASDAVEKLLSSSSSVLVDGKIDRRMALKTMEMRFVGV